MGELLHALKAYRDWTGDDSLIREHRVKLRALLERTLRPEFRDRTGMVHNRREFWERTFEDAYELVYQTYLVLGLRDAAALAEPLGAADSAGRWLSEADRIQKATFEPSGHGLVENGHLIKRRGVNGESVRAFPFGDTTRMPHVNERVRLANPDAGTALPIIFGLLPPRSALARNTLDELEKLLTHAGSAVATSVTIPVANAISPAPGRLRPVSSSARSTRRGTLGAAAARWSGLTRFRGAARERGSRKFLCSDPRRRPRAFFPGPPAKSACSSSATCWVFASKEIKLF